MRSTGSKSLRVDNAGHRTAVSLRWPCPLFGCALLLLSCKTHLNKGSVPQLATGSSISNTVLIGAVPRKENYYRSLRAVAADTGWWDCWNSTGWPSRYPGLPSEHMLGDRMLWKMAVILICLLKLHYILIKFTRILVQLIWSVCTFLSECKE